MPLNHSTPLFSARCALSPARTAAWPTSRTTPQPRATIRAIEVAVRIESSGSVSLDLGFGARFESPAMVGDTGVDSEAEDVGISSAATSALLVGMARMTPPLTYACPGVVPDVENARVDGCRSVAQPASTHR